MSIFAKKIFSQKWAIADETIADVFSSKIAILCQNFDTCVKQKSKLTHPKTPRGWGFSRCLCQFVNFESYLMYEMIVLYNVMYLYKKIGVMRKIDTLLNCDKIMTLCVKSSSCDSLLHENVG